MEFCEPLLRKQQKLIRTLLKGLGGNGIKGLAKLGLGLPEKASLLFQIRALILDICFGAGAQRLFLKDFPSETRGFGLAGRKLLPRFRKLSRNRSRFRT